ncbi:hypothetical protein, partial [Patulibacter medicamentivorans]|uniref:hypothetical protein n=1 Tax=Patulibacter medicamentivorans TaxID=1097667 RepID=UPI00058E926C
MSYAAPISRHHRPLRRRLRTRAVSAALLLLATLGIGASTAQAERIGLNGQQIITDIDANPARSNLLIDTAAGMRAKELRIPVGWGWIERTPPTTDADGTLVHSYDWNVYDRSVLAMARRGVRTWADLDGTPKFEVPSSCWRGGQGVGMPDHPEYFGAFAKAFVARYGPGGTLWAENPGVAALPVTTIELRNEQNHPYRWCGGNPNGAEYAQLVRSVLDELGPDRSVKVVTGGLYPLYDDRGDATVPDSVYLTQMRDADPTILDDVDAIGLHDYADQAGGTSSYSAFANGAMVELALTRWKMMMAGIPPWKPVAITETGIAGVPTLTLAGVIKISADLNDGARGQAIVDASRRMLAADCGVDTVQVHTLATTNTPPSLAGYPNTADLLYRL